MADRLVYIGLGSNVGDRKGHLERAIRGLEEAGLRVVGRSSVYLADPVEVVDQDEFMNQAVACETDLGPERLVEICLGVEREMGRVRTRPKGPRIIDLDLLLAGEEVRDSGAVEVPHPRLHLRRFVLVPLAEIAPRTRHPILGLTAAELLARCPDRARVEPAPR